MELAMVAPLCAFEKPVGEKTFLFNLIVIPNVTLKGAVRSLHMGVHVTLFFLEREIQHG